MFKEVLVSCTQSLLKQQEFNVLAKTLLAVSWARVCKVSCWHAFDLDHVLDLGDNLFKHLGFNRYLDASDLPNQIVLEDFKCSVTELNLNDGGATIGSKTFLLNPFQNRLSALLFMNGTVTAIIELSSFLFI